LLRAIESDDDDGDMNDSSDSVYEDHVSHTSEHSDVESADDTAAATDNSQPANQALDTTGGNRGGGRGRGRGRGRVCRGGLSNSSVPLQQQDGEDGVSPVPVAASFAGKNGFVWERQLPKIGKHCTQDIIRTMPGVTSESQCSSIIETMQLYLTPEIISNIVLQTNREANSRIRD